MKTCFVIQRFDGDIYDKRYRETFAPAIERGGAKGIRADEVVGTRPVVEKIEEGLRSADVAFAEISEDNGNVFLELGYALALGIPTVIVCDKAKRNHLPFDVAHRTVCFYATNAQSDYEKISREIEQSVAAALLEATSKRQVPDLYASNPTEQQVDDIKGACLLALLDRSLRSPIGATLWEIQREVASSGLTEGMVALAITSLEHDKLIIQHVEADRDGEEYLSFSLSEHGKRHLLRSYSALMQQERDRVSNNVSTSGFPDDLEDVPF